MSREADAFLDRYRRELDARDRARRAPAGPVRMSGDPRSRRPWDGRRCLACGRRLTDPLSKSRGFGRDCWEYLGSDAQADFLAWQRW